MENPNSALLYRIAAVFPKEESAAKFLCEPPSGLIFQAPSTIGWKAERSPASPRRPECGETGTLQGLTEPALSSEALSVGGRRQ